MTNDDGKTLGSLDQSTALAAALNTLALLLAAAVLAGVELPLVHGARSAFIILAVVGLGSGGVGLAASSAALGWRNPINLAGNLLVGLALLVIVAVGLGLRLPFLPDDRAALAALFGVLLASWLLSGLRFLR